MIATNASGMRAIKYGAMRDYVLGLEVVLASGEVIKVGTSTLKNSSGYQLERLFVGSEGTLGHNHRGDPAHRPQGQEGRHDPGRLRSPWSWPGNAYPRSSPSPCIPSAIELMDSTCIKAVNKTVKAGFPDVEASVHDRGRRRAGDGGEGGSGGAGRYARRWGRRAWSFPLTRSKWPNGPTAGRASCPRCPAMGEGFVSVSLADDMAVPISKIPDAVVAFQAIAKRNGVIVGTYGHAADGNLHTKMLLDPTSEEYWRRGEKAVGRDIRRGHLPWRNGHRRAWGGHIQGALHAQGAPAGTGDHAPLEARHGPQQHPQPREDDGLGGEHHPQVALSLPEVRGLGYAHPRDSTR